MRYLKHGAGLGLTLMVLLGLLTAVRAAAVGSNPGFNNPFQPIPGREYRGQSQLIADGWTPFYIAANTDPGSGNASRLRWMSSAQFAATFGGLDYHIEGDQAQNMWSSYKFDAGVYQQISGLTPGQAYGFDVGMVTYWRGPGYPDSDGKMVKRVGIDPTGGTDPTSSTLVWSETDSNDKAWVYMDVAATVQASTITVFAKVQAPENESVNHTDLDMVYFDVGHLDIAPSASLAASANGTTINANWSGVAAPGWSIKGYEVQYQDLAEGNWLTLQNKNQTGLNTSFTGQAGHTYKVRVRAWQRTSESYNSDIDMPGVWVEKSVILGNAVTGQVRNYLRQPLSGVEVAVQGTASQTTSLPNGAYTLPTGGPGTFSIVATDVVPLVAPPATMVTVPANGLVTLTLTLRPTGAQQGLSNNDFESDLTGWQLSNGTAATASGSAHHTGQRGLWISNTLQISQTGLVTDMANPTLSFWYKNNTPFTAELRTGASPVLSQALSPAADWAHALLELGSGSRYSGTVGVDFSYSGGAGAVIYIDEVSLGPGLARTYLPYIIKP